MINLNLAKLVLDFLHDSDVQSLVVCPGARNSPFVEVLKGDHRFKFHRFFDERAAAFWALGQIQVGKKPAAVITTSGTAVGELLPAVMEAHYSQLPLIVVTADRPARFRGTGAPQTAEQVNIFGPYVSHCLDIDAPSKLKAGNLRRPLHLNVCFDEPLPFGPSEKVQPGSLGTNEIYIDGNESEFDSVTVARDSVYEFVNTHKNQMVAIVGGLHSEDVPSVQKFLSTFQIPFYAEGPSHLREYHSLKPLQIQNIDFLLNRAQKSGWSISGVLRLGDIPTHRLWRDLESKTSLPVLSLSRKPFSGLPSSKLVYTENLFWLSELTAMMSMSSFNNFQKVNGLRDRNIEKILDRLQKSEPGLIRRISELVPLNSRVFLGNSLPIRQWDLAATWETKNIFCHGSRGLNGIDGQVSTFLGGVEFYPGPSWAIVGDLTALYDLQSLWAVSSNPEMAARFKLVIINNSGGRIFDRIFKCEDYSNAHNLNFEGWAKMWNLNYALCDFTKSETEKMKLSEVCSSSAHVIEVKPCPTETNRFWKEYEEL